MLRLSVALVPHLHTCSPVEATLFAVSEGEKSQNGARHLPEPDGTKSGGNYQMGCLNQLVLSLCFVFERLLANNFSVEIIMEFQWK